MDTDPTSTLRSFDASLDSLEATLAPLLSRPLNETREALGGIERAKLDVLVAYTVNNLVWMYLKTRGIEPDTHGVHAELERIKGYYTKVREAEGEKPKTRNRIDKDAARRFITHNISKGPANANAALARKQAEAAVRERIDSDSAATRSNRFRHVASEASKFDGEKGDDGDEHGDEGEEVEGMDVDGYEEEGRQSGNSEDEAAALLAEVDEMAEDKPVPEPERVEPVEKKSKSSRSSRTKAKRKRAEEMA